MKIQSRVAVHVLFLTTGLIFLVCGIFMKEVLELQFYDTYFLISQKLIAVYTGILFIIFGALYLTLHRMKNRLHSSLGKVHYLMMIAASVTLVAIPFLKNFWNDSATMKIGSMIVMGAVLLFLLGLIIFLTHAVRSLTRHG
jgi:heme/copper-type cytochrome/quinol oxidase subunit 1